MRLFSVAILAASAALATPTPQETPTTTETPTPTPTGIIYPPEATLAYEFRPSDKPAYNKTLTVLLNFDDVGSGLGDASALYLLGPEYVVCLPYKLVPDESGFDTEVYNTAVVSGAPWTVGYPSTNFESESFIVQCTNFITPCTS